MLAAAAALSLSPSRSFPAKVDRAYPKVTGRSCSVDLKTAWFVAWSAFSPVPETSCTIAWATAAYACSIMRLCASCNDEGSQLSRGWPVEAKMMHVGVYGDFTSVVLASSVKLAALFVLPLYPLCSTALRGGKAVG